MSSIRAGAIKISAALFREASSARPMQSRRHVRETPDAAIPLGLLRAEISADQPHSCRGNRLVPVNAYGAVDARSESIVGNYKKARS